MIDRIEPPPPSFLPTGIRDLSADEVRRLAGLFRELAEKWRERTIDVRAGGEEEGAAVCVGMAEGFDAAADFIEPRPGILLPWAWKRLDGVTPEQLREACERAQAVGIVAQPDEELEAWREAARKLEASDPATFGERPTLLYTASYVTDGLAGHAIGCRVDETRATTTAAPDNRENRSPGAWRTNDRQSDAALRAWVSEWWPEGTPLRVFEVVRA